MPKASKPKSRETGSRRREGNGHAVDARSSRTCTYEEIAARAYNHFLARGCQHGDDLADWFRAEAELRNTAEPATPALQPTR